jgi:hypothetical protein
MGDIDRAIADLLIQRSIDLARLEASVRNKVLDMLNQLQKELKAKLAAQDDLTDYGKQRLGALLRESNTVIDDYFKQARDEVDDTLSELAKIEAEHAADVIDAGFQTAVQVSIDASLPSQTMMQTLASDVLIQGAPSKAWWDKQSESTAFNFSQAIRQGMLQGETNSQIVGRIIGTKDAPGIMDISRRNATALVHTSVQTVANESRLATFRANSDVIAGLRWITTLDGRACIRCVGRAGLLWDMNGKSLGNSVSFQNPPIHFGDRCVLIPATRSYKEMGIDLPEKKRGVRASDQGPVDENISFEDFLRGKSVAYQDDLLGPGRAKLFRGRIITLNQLIDGSGRELTIPELKALSERRLQGSGVDVQRVGVRWRVQGTPQRFASQASAEDYAARNGGAVYSVSQGLRKI